MKRTGSVAREANASATSTESVTRATKLPKGVRFVVCVNNQGYQASLERNRIHIALPDPDAESGGDLRVIDESGEDYMFSAERFVAVELPQAVRASVRQASEQPPGVSVVTRFRCATKTWLL